MDYVEEMAERAQQLVDDANSDMVRAGNAEVSSYIASLEEQYHNHWFTFNDGMGCKSFKVYRKVDRKCIAVIMSDNNIGDSSYGDDNKYYASPFRAINQVQLFRDISEWLGDLEKVLTGDWGHVNLEAYNLPDRFEE